MRTCLLLEYTDPCVCVRYLLVIRIHLSSCVCAYLLLEYTDPCVCVRTSLLLEYIDPCVCIVACHWNILIPVCLRNCLSLEYTDPFVCA